MLNAYCPVGQTTFEGCGIFTGSGLARGRRSLWVKWGNGLYPRFFP